MNILVLCYEYPPIGGGGGVGAKQYAEAWAQKGHTVRVLTSWARGLKFKETLNDVEIIRVFTLGRKDRATATFLSMVTYIFFGITHVLAHRRRYQDFDVANSHFSIPTGPLGVFVSKVLRVPHILTIIGGDIHDPTKKSSPHKSSIMRAINAFIINSADKVVAISSDTKRRAKEYYAIRKDIEIIHYGFIPVPLSRTRGTSPKCDDGKYWLVSVGRLVKRKGYEYLINCLKLLPQDICVRIIGDGPLENHLRDVSMKNDVSERVTFLGYRSREEIYEYMQDADCFVLPSIHEGLGIVVQEAMYVGLPIVCTDNGGQVDLVKEPRNGIVVKAGNVDMFAAGIMRFYADRQFGRSVGRNNKEDIKTYFMSGNSQMYIDLFEETIRKRYPGGMDRIPGDGPRSAVSSMPSKV